MELVVNGFWFAKVYHISLGFHALDSAFEVLKTCHGL